MKETLKKNNVITLSHFSEKRFVLSDRRYDNSRTWRDWHKPSGFWLSDERSGQGWYDWCKANDFQVNALEHRTDFICDTSTWLVMKTSKELNSFSEKYGKPLREILDPENVNPNLADPSPDHLKFDGHIIQWSLVQEEFGGVLITPYVYRSRLEIMWYYGWDCASACVWDLKTIRVGASPWVT